MNRIYVQFDVDTPDPAALQQALREAGIPAVSVESSRWVRHDELHDREMDAGPRLDVGLSFAAQAIQAEARASGH